MFIPKHILVVDVAPRDGLQSLPKWIPTEEKVWLCDRLTDLGMPDGAARATTAVLGVAVLALAWRRRSLGLAIAAALVLSPIVWRHFFVLLVVPLGLSRPRFDAVWLIPIGLWVGDGTFNGAPWQTAFVLALVALTFTLCELRPQPVATKSRDLSPAPA